MIEARHWQHASNLFVRCAQCPRKCSIGPNTTGFCGTRRNIGGTLFAENYGRGLPLCLEPIESEALYHYLPGTRVLCIGNYGCMLDCDFCQNWQTSNTEHLDKRLLQEYSPKDVVDIALRNSVRAISWTYNDPVVWHEFVMDTSTLARAAGIRVVYKSSLYIAREPLSELIGVVDAFSVSLKSNSDSYYRNHTGGGTLGPVLDAITMIHRQQNKHLEISQLIVTDLNDSETDIRQTCSWVSKNLGTTTPLHFVRFHPAYKYAVVPRTSDERILRACQIAREFGIKYVYAGNTLDTRNSNTKCHECGTTVIRRVGSSINSVLLVDEGCCPTCGERIGEVSIQTDAMPGTPDRLRINNQITTKTDYRWDSDQTAVHLTTDVSESASIVVTHLPSRTVEEHSISGRIHRLCIPRLSASENMISVVHPPGTRILGLDDRAHFAIPTE